MLAGSVAAGAAFTGAAGEETAFVNPRIAPGAGSGLDGADLPHPLAPSDAARLRRIFALQLFGHIAEASAEMAGLADPLLNGHVLAQRYLGRHTEPNSAELAAWLARYPDHPDAPAIHALLLKRVGAGLAAMAAPDAARLEPDSPEAAPPEEDEPAGANLSRNPLLDRTVHTRAQAGHADSALDLLRRTKGLTALYGGQLRAEIAQALFTQGRDGEALRTAQDALHRTNGAVGLAGYVAGLAAWRLGHTEDALGLFETASHASLAPAALRSGAAFWAARAHARNHDSTAATVWLKQAAVSRHTFYGLLARRTLRMNADPQDGRETLGAAGRGRAYGDAGGTARVRPAASGPTAPRGGRVARALAAGGCGPGAERRHDARGRGRRANGLGGADRRADRGGGGPAHTTTRASQSRRCAQPVGSGSTRRWCMHWRGSNPTSTPMRCRARARAA